MYHNYKQILHYLMDGFANSNNCCLVFPGFNFEVFDSKVGDPQKTEYMQLNKKEVKNLVQLFLGIPRQPKSCFTLKLWTNINFINCSR